jgi:transcriptional regulator with XRE-family HTH domain
MFALSHPDYIRAKAVELRTQRNLSIDEIAERLALSRTTVYYWLRDVPIDRAARPRTVAQLSGNLAMQEKYRRLREAAYEEGRASFDELARDPSFRDFVCMYLAEGYQRHRNYASVCNSDPTVVVLCHGWMGRLSTGTLDYGVQYHADQDLDELRRFWSAQLGIRPEQVRMQRKSNSNQLAGRTWRSVHGVLAVRVCDTIFRAKLEGWMDRLRESWL